VIVFADPVPRYLTAAGFVAAALMLVACADTRGGPIPYDRALATPDEPKISTLAANYKILPTDKLNIKVFKSEDLSGDYEVDAAGNISLPLIGAVEAANLTTTQLDERLTQKLSEKYLEHPDVAVSITESTRRAVTVSGAVKEAGTFQIPAPVSLIQAVAMAKGPSDDANPRRVAVFRTISGERQAAAFDLTAIGRGQAQDPQIYPGDIIVVDGSANKAFQKQFFQSMPLLNIFRPW
jgi:polysaccharide export outer membrane protein